MPSQFCKTERAHGLRQHQSKLPTASSEGPGRCHCKAIFHCLWKVVATEEGFWRLEEIKCHTCLQEGQEGRSRTLWAGHHTLMLGKVVKWVILDTNPKCVKDKRMTGSSFTKGKSHLTNIVGFFDKITGLVGKGRALDVVSLDLARLLTLSPIICLLTI